MLIVGLKQNRNQSNQENNWFESGENSGYPFFESGSGNPFHYENRQASNGRLNGV